MEPRGSRGDTPLIRAARFKRIDAARYLIEELKSELEVANRPGFTPLHEAVRVARAARAARGGWDGDAGNEGVVRGRSEGELLMWHRQARTLIYRQRRAPST